MQPIHCLQSKPALAAAVVLALPLYANADLLPPPNDLSVIEYNDFVVYSLELLEKCSADPRCQPASADLDQIGGGPGQIADLVVLLSAANGGQVNDNTTALGGLGDDPFPSPTGDGEGFVMDADNEPAPSFAGDQTGSWDVQVGALTDWLLGNDLVFMLNNNQQGDDINQWLQGWAQVKLYDEFGAEQNCYELSNGVHYSGCKVQGDPVLTPPSNYLTDPGDYIVTFTGFCVDKVTGATFNLGGAGNDGDCVDPEQGWDGYFVSGNLGNFADNAIFSQDLNDYLYNTAQPDWTLSIDIRLANNNNGGEYIWITNQFEPRSPPPVPVPVPGSLLLLGSGLLVLRYLRRRKV